MRVNKQNFLGLIIGLLTPLLFLPLVLFLLSLYNGTSISSGWYMFTHNVHYTSKYLSLGCIPNLIWFYLFLNKEDKNKYEENLEEEKKSPENITKNDKSVDLMRRLSDYLGY